MTAMERRILIPFLRPILLKTKEKRKKVGPLRLHEVFITLERETERERLSEC